jgi:hypothetical protein
MDKCLIIISMHRSGTSFTASLLQNAGLNIGEMLMEKHASNPKGHFENKDFWSFHRKVLKENHLNPDGWDLKTISFQKKYEEEAKALIAKNTHTYWGWKDPRTALFLDFWKQLLPDAYFLFIYRSPWEVVDSIYRRKDVVFKDAPEKAIEVWLFYNQVILDFYENNRACSALYNLKNIIGYPEGFLSDMNERFGFDLKLRDKKIFDKKIFNRTNINQNFQQALIYHYSPEAFMLYKQLEQLNEGKKISSDILSAFLKDSKIMYQQWYRFDKALNEISWMKDSKFWKLRNALIKMKVWEKESKHRYFY